MVRTSNERISADTGHGCCLRRHAPAYVPVSMPENLLVLVNTPQTIAEPVVKPTSTPTMVMVPV
jgi:hypothetical protein